MSKQIKFKKDIYDYTNTVKRFSKGEVRLVRLETNEAYFFTDTLGSSIPKSTEDNDYTDLYDLVDDTIVNVPVEETVKKIKTTKNTEVKEVTE